MMQQSKLLFLSIIVLFTQCQPNENIKDHLWPDVKPENKPGIYWWWMGSAVDKENLTYNLESLAEAGIGNVHVIPIYGVKGEEHRYIDFLNPKWMNMLDFTVKEASRLDMNVDMSTTTGWPFGGSHVGSSYAASKIEFEKIEVSGNKRIIKQLPSANIEAVIAYSDDNKIVNLSDKITEDGVLNWLAPIGKWEIYITYKIGTGQKVKRAAPGNIGLVLDPFSPDGLENYLERYNKAFKNYKNIGLRAQYHDSYEYYHASWTNNFYDIFQSKNGYDLRNYLPGLLDSNKINSYIKADYRRTLADLHLDYIEKWTDWSHKKGWITRNQAHGAPANLLDLYAASDIPETETFGSRRFEIPGLRYVVGNNSTSEPPNPLILKFASSAAHVTGKNLIASETGTWLREHYKSSLSQVKPEIDELFFSGINHIFYHGNAYSPKNAAWPGWIFYASTHFEKENAFWYDFSELNTYVTRCQSILQSGKPANDVLLYWPVEDIYHVYPDFLVKNMNVHDTEWFENSEFGKLASLLENKGFSFDYISDKQLLDVSYENKGLVTNKNMYKTILIPKTKHIPLKTWKQLLRLAENGATI
ncbi:MAG: glycoside hydrolase, partial [Bacteroidetes bacterium]